MDHRWLTGMSVIDNRLIVALDVATAAEALRLVNTLRGLVAMFKVGSQLFTTTGPELVRKIVDSGERVFLDLKFHDIPNTVANAGVAALDLGVSIFNVHALGGSEMMRRTVDATTEAAEKARLTRPSIIAVTALTSADATTLSEIGLVSDAEAVVRRMALLAEAAGLDGVVASAREVKTVRSAVSAKHFLIVTPGVRPAGAALGDQKRVTTPSEAINAGADYVVVGRPILEAPDPARAAQQVLDELRTTSANAVY
jgi:orotidine-5'-phosphate decarboxylase